MDDDSFYCLHSELCKTLANPKRQMILDCLREGEVSVGEIANQTDIPQATLSQHLSILRSRGVVRTRRAGSSIYYAIANPKIITAFDLITEVLRESLGEQVRTAGTDESEKAKTA